MVRPSQLRLPARPSRQVVICIRRRSPDAVLYIRRRLALFVRFGQARNSRLSVLTLVRLVCSPRFRFASSATGGAHLHALRVIPVCEVVRRFAVELRPRDTAEAVVRILYLLPVAVFDLVHHSLRRVVRRGRQRYGCAYSASSSTLSSRMHLNAIIITHAVKPKEPSPWFTHSLWMLPSSPSASAAFHAPKFTARSPQEQGF